MILVRPGEPAAVSEVGGKGRSLLDLHARSLPVPDFFIVTTEAYRRACDGRLVGADRDAVVAAWRQLGGPVHPVAVRSSGVDEDSADDSYAGVFETVLDVDSEVGLLEAIERCWASSTTQVAQAYRIGRHLDAVRDMAVVVQRMAPVAWAGVVFTADPVRGALSVVRVSAVAGPGEALVSGAVDPEEIVLEASTGHVTERRCPPGRDPLPDAILTRVVERSREVVATATLPQDIEWAADQTDVHLLQSRPITTMVDIVHARPLEPWHDDPLADPDAVGRTWTRAYADEMWTPPVSPLFYDVQNLTGMVTGYLRRHGVRDHLPPDVFKYHRAAAYLDVALLEQMLLLQPRSMRTEGALAQLPAARRDAMRRAPWNWRGVLRRLVIFELRHRTRWSVTRTWRYLEASWPAFLGRTGQWVGADLASLDDDALASFEEDVRATAATVGPECSIAVTYHAADLRIVLTGLIDRWTTHPPTSTYAEVTGGLDDSVTVAEAQAIWETAQLARATDAGSRAILDGISLEGARAGAHQLGLAAALDRFDRFLATHGHRGASYKDLVHPRWGDRPDALWALVAGQVRDHGGSPVDRHARTAAHRRATQADVLDSIGGPLRTIKRRVLGRILLLNERYASLRDNHRFYYDHIWWAYRRVYVERGRRLTARRLLDAPDDIMFLVRAEIEGLADGRIDREVIAERVRVRRRSWERTRTESPPKYLASGYLPMEDPTECDVDHRLFSGIPASPGNVIGRVRVAHDASELGAVRVGEILVARQTDPSWSPIFSKLGGLVLETGGVLAHGASLCREYGLPCVTVVERATTGLATGDVVELSGSTGSIRVLTPVGGEEVA